MTLLGSQNGIQTGQLELPGRLPESIFKPNISKSWQILARSSQEASQTAMLKVKIGNFLPDPGQELPGGLPENSFKGKISNFLSDSAQDLPRGFSESNFKREIGNFLPDP